MTTRLKIINKRCAISEIFAVILLIGIAVAVSVPLLIAFNKPPSEPPVIISLDVEYNKDAGMLLINHISGDNILNAYAIDNGNYVWKNLEVKVTGNSPDIASITGNEDFSSGSTLKVQYSGDIPSDGSTFSFIYKPANQLIKSFDV
ncbi:MAG: hypothetical protein DRO67_09915 [Candidatus Asgardarchaeum californiense]|nr:MAG: hypothetical protein DRO67_09915 [Candidatus Asgardarchaeum californiense]